MKIEQLYTNCLAEAAYYIESNGEAAIIDPLRETKPYLNLIEKNNVKLKYIFETHFHADFVSGHIDLADKTNAKIIFGPTASTGFDFIMAEDNQVFHIGDIQLKVLHTPGHTLESTTYLLIDELGKNHAIFTGDTLFLGDVGRPDLAVKSNISKQDLAGMLFESLRNKIMTLDDDVIVYPAHGAGSACGKNMSNETVGTLGEQKRTNYALRADMTKEEFIDEVTKGLTDPPQYFPKNVLLNKMGYQSIDLALSNGLTPLHINNFEMLMNSEKNVIVLDTRQPTEFTKAHIPNSLFVGIDGSFATWIGTLIEDLKTPFLIICENGREEEVVTRLARVGYDNALGFLEGGFQTWLDNKKPIQTIKDVEAEKFAQVFNLNPQISTLDVRKRTEYLSENIEGVMNLPLDSIYTEIETLDKNSEYYVHCQGGYRSVIAASILKMKGFEVVNILGGFVKLKETNLKFTDYVCSTTLS